MEAPIKACDVYFCFKSYGEFKSGEYYRSVVDGTLHCNNTNIPISPSSVNSFFLFVGSTYTNSYDTLVEEDTKRRNYSDARVNHPSHYTWLKSLCGIEVIDITRHLNFNIGNIIKYVLRAGHKQESDMKLIDKQIEDLKKARFYINDEIQRLENGISKN